MAAPAERAATPRGREDKKEAPSQGLSYAADSERPGLCAAYSCLITATTLPCTCTDAGSTKIGGKITEEAREVVEAAHEPGDAGRAHLLYEAADLTYHLFVMLGHHGITLAELESELGRRFGLSGLEEKASRPPKASE